MVVGYFEFRITHLYANANATVRVWLKMEVAHYQSYLSQSSNSIPRSVFSSRYFTMTGV
jgi:hypothetical protein